MRFVFKKCLAKAYIMSDEFSRLLTYSANKMISTSNIIREAEEEYDIDIDVKFMPFPKESPVEKYGAMMRTKLNENGVPERAEIIINSSREEEFQRFSLVHEIGHLITHAWEDADVYRNTNQEAFAISSHIDFDITNIPEEEYRKNAYLKNEQIANIFALRVLMPSDIFYKKMEECENLSDVADFFGVTKGAVISRARIGDSYEQE